MVRQILKDLPYDMKGFVTEDIDGNPVVMLNSRMSRETNLATFEHETKHIAGNDLDKELDVNEKECDLHEVR
jgi:hypothetical protein